MATIPATRPEDLARLPVRCPGCGWAGLAGDAHCPPDAVVTCRHCGAAVLKVYCNSRSQPFDPQPDFGPPPVVETWEARAAERAARGVHELKSGDRVEVYCDGPRAFFRVFAADGSFCDYDRVAWPLGQSKALAVVDAADRPAVVEAKP